MHRHEFREVFMRTIKVMPYNNQWENEFKKAQKFYQKLLKELCIEIEHVGSTSVKGLWAKPILDIDIIVPTKEVSIMVIKKLEGVGYKHIGDCGIEDREAFSYDKNNPNINWMQHNLYVCIEGSEGLINHLLLRNHLRNNKHSVEAYGKLKQALAKKYPKDISAYVEGKTALITRILEKEGLDKKSLSNITKVNKKDK